MRVPKVIGMEYRKKGARGYNWIEQLGTYLKCPGMAILLYATACALISVL